MSFATKTQQQNSLRTNPELQKARDYDVEHQSHHERTDGRETTNPLEGRPNRTAFSMSAEDPSNIGQNFGALPPEMSHRDDFLESREFARDKTTRDTNTDYENTAGYRV